MVFKRPKLVKRLFMVFMIYLPIQYMGVGIVGTLVREPWPAFVLPGFKNIFDTEQQVEIEKPHFYVLTEEQNVEVLPGTLFEGLQASQMQGFIRMNFREGMQYSSRAKNWLRDRVENVYPDVKARGLQVVWITLVFNQVDGSVEVHEKENREEILIPFKESQ